MFKRKKKGSNMNWQCGFQPPPYQPQYYPMQVPVPAQGNGGIGDYIKGLESLAKALRKTEKKDEKEKNKKPEEKKDEKKSKMFSWWEVTALLMLFSAPVGILQYALWKTFGKIMLAMFQL